ncbi:MAG: type II secretion system protein [Verrucomicrobia bacterium]|nr:type II secretion system protein [Verrucomicrobiota bacterium]
MNGARINGELRRRGFTLVELLTVIAIIAVLATLLTSALGSAKRKARQAACTSNLRQVALALNMYLDDHTRRPRALGTLVSTRYLPAPGVLRCPEDKTDNWGGLIQEPSFSLTESTIAKTPSFVAALPALGTSADLVPYSYFNPLGWEDTEWIGLLKLEPNPGIAACQLHGLGRADLSAPSVQNFEGLLLRAQMDGAVVRRQVYWETPREVTENFALDGPLEAGLAAPPAARTESTAAMASPVASLPWRFFSDKATP